MTYNLLYAGFDTLDVAFAGALRKSAFVDLERARQEAQDRQEKVLAKIGPGGLNVHVYGHGKRGGYAYICDTGPLGAIWMFKKNLDARQWNIFVSPHATMLLAYGYTGTRHRLWQTLEAMGAVVTDHSINRVDFAMDFRTQGFEVQLDQFVAHSHTKVRPYWGSREPSKDPNQPEAVMRGRRLESVTIGKQPNRQIILYDKYREVIEKQKTYWFKAWKVEQIDSSLEVWRVEVRSGKKHLKEKYKIRTFDDLETGIGDVIVNALFDVRYVAEMQRDSNITRQAIHPLWLACINTAKGKLIDFRSGLTPDQVRMIEREIAVKTYAKQLSGLAISLGVVLGLDDATILKDLVKHTSPFINSALKREDGQAAKTVRRARERLHFIS